MRNIFGFPIYSIKRCIFSEVELQNSKKSNLNLQSLANHASLEVSLGYAKDAVENNMKIIKDNLRIPNLCICPLSRDSLFRFLGKRLHFKKSAKIYQDWLSRLRSKLHNYNKAPCNYYDTDQTVTMDHHGNILFEDSEQISQKEDENMQPEEKMKN
jgi:hypothetical protein